MVVAIGTLMLKIKSVGFSQIITKTKRFQTQFGKMAKQVQPQIEKMTKSFAKMGIVISGAFFALIKASPRLSAEMEILSIRVEQFLRPFGDELAPLVDDVAVGVDGLTEAFKSLPQPIQDAATFAVGFTVSVGVAAGAIAGLMFIMGAIPTALWVVLGAAFLFGLAWELNWLDIQGTVETVVGHLEDAWESMIDTIEALQEGDLPAALDALSAMFYSAGAAITVAIFDMPVKFVGGLETFLTTAGVHMALWLNTFIGDFSNAVKGLLPDLFQMGKDLIEAFIKGMIESFERTVGGFEKWLESFAMYLGGSLPEKGPLMHIETYGEELGQAYVKSIGSGIQQQTNRTLNITNLNLGFRGESLDTERSFFDDMDEGVRRSTSW